jgi:hypothetical protein
MNVSKQFGRVDKTLHANRPCPETQGQDGSATATNGGGKASFGAAAAAAATLRSASAAARLSTRPVSIIQRRARLAFTPWAIDTAAMETPGWLHAATTCALN